MKTHKLTKKHIQCDRHKMNVRIAVETFSESVANSIEFLMNQNHPDFIGAAATVKFIRIMNKLFDIFNSKSSKSNNIYKREISSENKRVIFDFFESTIKYFMSLEIFIVSYKKNKAKGSQSRVIEVKKKQLLIKSINKTCARGFIIDMMSTMALYVYIKFEKKIKIKRIIDFQNSIHPLVFPF